MAVPPPPPGFQIVTQPTGPRPAIAGPPRLPTPQTPAQAAYDEQQAKNAQLEGDLKRLQIAEAQRNATEDADKRAKVQDQRELAKGHMLRIISNLDRSAVDANDNGGWGETGTSGWLMRKVGPAGTAGYDLKRNLDLPGAITAIDNLMEMRRNSPTGGAMGNVSDKDMQLMKDLLGIIDPDQSHGTFMLNMAEAKREVMKNLAKIDPKAVAQYMRSNPRGVWMGRDGGWKIGTYRNDPAPSSDVDAILKKYGM
ncbi:MAG TPA: hypothetical protein VJ859_02970 [Allosphingosinicella sp.]|nr:hypothetical protein [Allosphingosinicella sp.]